MFLLFLLFKARFFFFSFSLGFALFSRPQQAFFDCCFSIHQAGLSQFQLLFLLLGRLKKLLLLLNLRKNGGRRDLKENPIRITKSDKRNRFLHR